MKVFLSYVSKYIKLNVGMVWQKKQKKFVPACRILFSENAISKIVFIHQSKIRRTLNVINIEFVFKGVNEIKKDKIHIFQHIKFNNAC